MIAGCIERMSRSACGDCERRDACAALFAGLFGPKAQPRRAPPPPVASQPGRRGSFLAFLGQVARAIEDSSGARETEAKPRETAFRREVERHVEPLLPSGAIRMDQVARDMGYSRQTLYRRLKGEGMTFEQLLDALRRRLALRMIRDEGLAVKDVAYRLGFSDPAAFSRAFKRWAGASPSELRGKRVH